MKSDADAAGRDEAAAEVLSIGYFTTLQVLFAIVLYLPMFLAILGVADLVDVGTFGAARFSTFVIAGLLAYLLALDHALRGPALGHAAQARPGW